MDCSALRRTLVKVKNHGKISSIKATESKLQPNLVKVFPYLNKIKTITLAVSYIFHGSKHNAKHKGKCM